MGVVLDLLDRNNSLLARRNIWLPIWQELAELLYPSHGGFVTPLIPGREPQVEQYDGTPMHARRGLATAIDSLMKPSTTKWFWIRAKNDDLNEIDEAKIWFEHVQDRMWSALYDPQARFIQHSGAVDSDLAAFGLGYLWIGENKAKSGLNFRSLHIGDCVIDEDADGQVDTIFICRKFTARQAAQRFKKLPTLVQDALKGPNSAKKKDDVFEFLQCIYPREDRDPTQADSGNMPYANCIVFPKGEELVEEGGFEEFPVAIPRWDVAAGQIYPYSPGMMALPDSRTLQAMGHTLLVGGQRAVDPPIWVADDAAISAVRTFPGGLTTVDSEVVRQTGGKPLGLLDIAANVPLGREMQQDVRQMVGAAFFKEVFAMPNDREMTATEVMERKEEFIRTIGPTMGQLENDYIGVIIRRVFGIMLRAGAFRPPPDVLAGQDAEFEFMSPIQQAKRQIETAGMGRAFEFMGPIIQLQPETADNFNGDEIARDAPEIFAVPERWIRDKNTVAGIRQQRAQAQQAQQALQVGQQGADVLKTAADGEHSAARARLAGTQANQAAAPAA